MSSNSREKIEEQDINNNKLEDKKIKNENTLNINQTDENILEDDGVENLRFNSKLFLDVDKNDLVKKESIDLGIKFSIDYAPQQRLHEYLNNDLINALDNNLSNPQTPIIPISNNENNKNENNNNNDNKEKFNIEDIPKIDLGNEKEEEKEKENQNENNTENQNENNNENQNKNQSENQNQNNNENQIENQNEQFNNQIQTPLSLLKVNKFDYTKMKFNIPILNNMNNNINLNNINNQNKEKPKKHFEIRAGDWTCYDCNNLNFAFRIKCNRCGLPKEVSLQKFKMGLIKNLNIQSNSNIMFYPHNFNKDKNQ